MLRSAVGMSVHKPRPVAHLYPQPPEIIRHVAFFLQDLSDISSLSRTCQRLYAILDKFLYHLDANDFNPRALYFAVTNGQEDVARKALAAGTPVSTFCDGHKSVTGGFSQPLGVAVKNGHLGVARLLLEAGADASATVNSRGQTTATFAARRGDTKALSLMHKFDHTKINTADNNGHTPLSEAIRYGQLETTKILLSLDGLNVNYAPIGHMSPILVAARFGQLDVVRSLMARGAEVMQNASSLQYLCCSPDPDTAKCMEILFPQLQTQLDSASHTIYILLRKACQAGNVEVAKLFMEPSAEALCFALGATLASGNVELLRFLVARYHAQLHSPDGSYMDFFSFDWVTKWGTLSTVDEVIKLGNGSWFEKADVLDLLPRACSLGSARAARALFQEASETEVPEYKPASFSQDFWERLLAEACTSSLEAASRRLQRDKDLGVIVDEETIDDIDRYTCHIEAEDKSRTELVILLLESMEKCGNKSALESVFTPRKDAPSARTQHHYPQTLLEKACSHGQLAIIQALLRAADRVLPGGTSSVIGSHDHNRALLFACDESYYRTFIEEELSGQECRFLEDRFKKIEQDQLEIVQLLLSHGASAGLSPEGASALHIACKYGRLEAAKILHSHGSDPFSPNKQDLGRTPISYACSSGNIDLVKYLHDLGCTYNTPEPWTPLVSACRHITKPGQEKIAMMLISLGTVGVNTTGFCGNTSLHMVCKQRSNPTSLRLAKLLVQHGADISVTADRRETPLHLACRSGNYDLVRWLIKQGADVNAVDSKAERPLHYVCKNGSVPIFRLLVARGARLFSGVSEVEQSPLFTACYQGRVRLVQELIALGANPLQARRDGTTPLHMACAAVNGHEVVRILIACGADLRGRCPGESNDMTPLHFATYSNSYKSVKLLIEAGALHDTDEEDEMVPYKTKDENIERLLLETAPHLDSNERVELYLDWDYEYGDDSDDMEDM